MLNRWIFIESESCHIFNPLILKVDLGYFLVKISGLYIWKSSIGKIAEWEFSRRFSGRNALPSSFNASLFIWISVFPSNIFFNFKESFGVHTSCPCITKGRNKRDMTSNMSFIKSYQKLKSINNPLYFLSFTLWVDKFL